MKNQRPGKRPVVRVFWTSSPPKDHRKRLAYALGLSLSIHVFILSLQFGAPGLGLPGISLPWEERRLQVPELTVRLEPARPPASAPAAAPLQLRLSQSLSALPAEAPQPVTASRAGRPFEGALVRATPPPPISAPEVETRTPAPAAKARARERKVRPTPRPQILAQTDPQEDTFNVPPPKRATPEPQRAPERAAKKQSEESPAAVQTEQAARKAAEEAARRKAEQAARKAAEEAARLAAEEAARRRADDYARQLALALEKEFEEAKQEEARLIEDAFKQEEARRQALALKARELAEESARKEAEKLALQRALALEQEQEAKKQEEAKRLALEQEALKRAEAAAREQAVARQKELEARRLTEEAAARAKQTAERQRADAEAAAQRERLAAQKGPGAATAPGAPSGKELAAKALDQLRRPGAARDEVLRPPPPPRAENPRRRSIFGVERDVGLRMYVESWRSKIERHGALNYRHWVSRIARDNPIVTVSIRSDGSLEDVVIHRSSGVRELDEAVLRIARLHAPYSAFPPALATRYDVIEIRRVWFFDNTLKIMDEL